MTRSVDEQAAAQPRPPTIGERLAGVDRRLLWLLALAAAVRILYWAVFLRHYVPQSDAFHYFQIAENVAEGRGFVHEFPQLDLHPTAFRPPLFPLTLSLVLAVLWPAVAFGQALNLVLGVVAVGLTFRLTSEIGGRLAGTVAAVVVAVHPPLFFNDVVPLAESLALVLVLSLALAVRRDAYVWAGILTGLLVLDRTSAQAVVVLVVGWVAVRLGIRKAAVTLALAAAVVAPWVVRNAVELDAAVLVTSNGFNLAAKHSPEARATGRFVDPVYDVRFDEFRLEQFDEAQWDRTLTDYALDEIRRDPRPVARVVLRNVWELFLLRPSFSDSAERSDGRHAGVRTASVPFFYAASALGLVGVWRNRRDPTVLFLALVVGYFLALSLLLMSPPRLRWPFDLLCAIGIGLLAPTVRDRWAARRATGSAAPP